MVIVAVMIRFNDTFSVLYVPIARRRITAVFRSAADRCRSPARSFGAADPTRSSSVLSEPQPPGFAVGRPDDAESSHRTRRAQVQPICV